MASFYRFSPSSLTVVDDNNRVLMSSNTPVVETSVSVPDLQLWVTTLEEVALEERNHHQAWQIRRLIIFLQQAYQTHAQQHADFVSAISAAAPADIEEYLIRYTSQLSGVYHNG